MLVGVCVRSWLGEVRFLSLFSLVICSFLLNFSMLAFVLLRRSMCVLTVSTPYAHIPYYLDSKARVLLVSSELLEGVVFEGAFYSRARSIPFSLSVTKFFSKQ